MSENVTVRNLDQPESQQLRLDHLTEAIDDLTLATDTDDDCHCCTDEDCTPDAPRCSLNRSRAALRRIWQAFEFEIRSTWPTRLSHYPEWAFVEEFRRLNVRQPGVNRGYRTLEMILGQPREKRTLDTLGTTPAIVTQRDADVATAVIQWLGTNCGLSFLSQVERKIQQARHSEQVTSCMMHDWLWRQRRAPISNDPIQFEAERIAAGADPDCKLRDMRGHTLAEQIEGAIRRFSGQHSRSEASAESAAL